MTVVICLLDSGKPGRACPAAAAATRDLKYQNRSEPLIVLFANTPIKPRASGIRHMPPIFKGNLAH